MVGVDVVIDDDRWAAAGLDAIARGAAKATLEHLEFMPGNFEFCLLGCDDARIMALNKKFRGQSRPTNVLSWPSGRHAPVIRGGDPPMPSEGELGDIAIAYETCLREAGQQGKAFPDHVTHLLVHAVLHLLGYDHMDDRNAERMESLETEILASLGIKGPY